MKTLHNENAYIGVAIRVQIDPSALKWEGDMNDKKPQDIVEVEFPHIMIQTGQHIS